MKIKKSLPVLFVMLFGALVSAQDITPPMPGNEENVGGPGSIATSIDQYIPFLVLVALISLVYFWKRNKLKSIV